MLFQSLRLRIDRYMNVQKMVEAMYSPKSLSFAEAPAGYPYYIYKNSNNRKNRKRAGDDGKREKAGASLLSFPFPSCLARSLFLSPQPPHNTKRPLGRREALSPKIPVLRYCGLNICGPVGVWWADKIFYPMNDKSKLWFVDQWAYGGEIGLYPMNDKSKLCVVISKQIFLKKSWTECHRYPWKSHGWSSTRPSKQRQLAKPFCSQWQGKKGKGLTQKYFHRGMDDNNRGYSP